MSNAPLWDAYAQRVLQFSFRPETFWVISDTHFDHQNIVKYAARPANHNELMLDAWERLVQPDHSILHLGDVLFRPAHNVYLDRIKTLPGRWRGLVPGNHDHKRQLLEDIGFDDSRLLAPSHKNKMQGGYYLTVIDGVRVALSHAPLYLDQDWEINVHGHIHVGGYPEHYHATGKAYINVCAEVLDYQPVLLTDVLEGRAGQRIQDAPVSNADERLMDMIRE